MRFSKTKVVIAIVAILHSFRHSFGYEIVDVAIRRYLNDSKRFIYDDLPF